MSRMIALVYGLAAYLSFRLTILYAIDFVTSLLVPKTIDDGAAVSTAQALVVDLALMALRCLKTIEFVRCRRVTHFTQNQGAICYLMAMGRAD
jgi:hypothetical protein